MADRPLRPATRLRLGEPLPHQLPDRPRDPPGASEHFLTKSCGSVGVSGISPSFLGLSRSPGQVSHVLLTRSPLDLHQCCHWMDLARLACVRHAASVRPEPGSNSPSRSTAGHPKVFDRSIGFRRAGRLLQHSFRPTRLDLFFAPVPSGQALRGGGSGIDVMNDRVSTTPGRERLEVMVRRSPALAYRSSSVPFSRSAGGSSAPVAWDRADALCSAHPAEQGRPKRLANLP